MQLVRATPILRMFDEGHARAFYVDWLGFEVVFEHRFGPKMPLYIGLKKGDVELHLTEHYGDTTPGTRIRIYVHDIKAFYKDLKTRHFDFFNPGPPTKQPWGEWDLTLTDPFGNNLSFVEDIA